MIDPVSGAELLVEQMGPGVEYEEKENPNIFLVGASWQRLLSGAEEIGLFKEYKDGSMRGFTCANRHNFKDFEGNVWSSPTTSLNTPVIYLFEWRVLHSEWYENP